MRELGSIATAVLAVHGVALNVEPGQSEMVRALRGREAVAAKKSIWNQRAGIPHYGRVHGVNVAVRVVASYVHLGGKHAATSNIAPELERFS